MIVLQYKYNLSRSSQKCKNKLWCWDIVRAAENMKKKENTLIDLISINMLRMNYQHRQSASNCLRKVYYLKFHIIQSVKIEHTMSTKTIIDQDSITRIKSVIMQHH